MEILIFLFSLFSGRFLIRNVSSSLLSSEIFNRRCEFWKKFFVA